MVEIAEVRQRLRQTIDKVKREAVERRGATEAARREYDRFLEDVGVPVFRMFATALKAEGHLFGLSTPKGSVRITSERSPGDFIELQLDAARRPPAVIGRAVHAQGRELVTVERPLREPAPVSSLTDDDVLEFLLDEIGPFVER
jgi:hypothetical protein